MKKHRFFTLFCLVGFLSCQEQSVIEQENEIKIIEGSSCSYSNEDIKLSFNKGKNDTIYLDIIKYKDLNNIKYKLLHGSIVNIKSDSFVCNYFSNVNYDVRFIYDYRRAFFMKKREDSVEVIEYVKVRSGDFLPNLNFERVNEDTSSKSYYYSFKLDSSLNGIYSFKLPNYDDDSVIEETVIGGYVPDFEGQEDYFESRSDDSLESRKFKKKLVLPYDENNENYEGVVNLKYRTQDGISAKFCFNLFADSESNLEYYEDYFTSEEFLRAFEKGKNFFYRELMLLPSIKDSIVSPTPQDMN